MTKIDRQMTAVEHGKDHSILFTSIDGELVVLKDMHVRLQQARSNVQSLCIPPFVPATLGASEKARYLEQVGCGQEKEKKRRNACRMLRHDMPRHRIRGVTSRLRRFHAIHVMLYNTVDSFCDEKT